MKLYSIEYQINRTGQVFTCKTVGQDEQDVVNDISSMVGEITVQTLYFVMEVHRITDSIRRQIVERSIKGQSSTKKGGRPRKYELF
jgi:hypothetical protein